MLRFFSFPMYVSSMATADETVFLFQIRRGLRCLCSLSVISRGTIQCCPFPTLLLRHSLPSWWIPLKLLPRNKGWLIVYICFFCACEGGKEGGGLMMVLMKWRGWSLFRVDGWQWRFRPNSVRFTKVLAYCSLMATEEILLEVNSTWVLHKYARHETRSAVSNE